jgi:hypothetical protein
LYKNLQTLGSPLQGGDFQSFGVSLQAILMEIYLLCAFAFLAGFIDSIVGGGGLVQIPAFFVLYPQLPIPGCVADA